MSAVNFYGFRSPNNALFGGDEHADYDDHTLSRHELSTFTVASLAHIVYTFTELSYFAVIGMASLSALSVCLARRVFRHYPFFSECEKLSAAMYNRYRLVPLIASIVAAELWSTFPAACIGISVTVGTLAGFALRIKRLSHKMGS